jgi:hypothetical protein
MTSMMNTGKYFDEVVNEDFTDIAAEEDDDQTGNKPAKAARAHGSGAKQEEN